MTFTAAKSIFQVTQPTAVTEGMPVTAASGLIGPRPTSSGYLSVKADIVRGDIHSVMTGG